VPECTVPECTVPECTAPVWTLSFMSRFHEDPFPI